MEDYDFIIGSDVTIVTQHTPHLIRVLREIASPETRIILGSVGQRDGYAPFLSLAAAENFVHTDIVKDRFHPAYQSDRIALVELSPPVSVSRP